MFSWKFELFEFEKFLKSKSLASFSDVRVSYLRIRKWIYIFFIVPRSYLVTHTHTHTHAHTYIYNCSFLQLEIVICDLRLESKWRLKRSMRDISVYFIISVPAAIMFLDYDRLWRTKGNDGLIFHNLHRSRSTRPRYMVSPMSCSLNKIEWKWIFQPTVPSFSCVHLQKNFASLRFFFRKFYPVHFIYLLWIFYQSLRNEFSNQLLDVSPPRKKIAHLFGLSSFVNFTLSILSTNYSINRLPHKRINFSSVRQKKKKKKKREKKERKRGRKKHQWSKTYKTNFRGWKTVK